MQNKSVLEQLFTAAVMAKNAYGMPQMLPLPVATLHCDFSAFCSAHAFITHTNRFGGISEFN